MAKQENVTVQKDGIEKFILNKLDKAHTVPQIRAMLENAGFSKKEIERGLDKVKKTHKTFHQDIAASNNFFPLLSKKRINVEHVKRNSISRHIEDDMVDHTRHLGLFAGRIRRKDFVVGVLFLFSLFFSSVIVIASFVDALYPEVWKSIGHIFDGDKNGALLLFAPVLFAPFTLILLSLITRRLHDLELPGIISFLYLGVFIYPFSQYTSSGIIALDCVLFVLFFFLMSKLGSSEPNKYGKLPVAHGSTFTKILNLK